MIRSMTGFGRAAGAVGGESVTVELTAVNHRFLETSIRLPHSWISLEAPLRECVKKHLSRGKVNVSVRRERGPQGNAAVRLDHEVAKQYVEAARELAEVMSSMDKLSLDTLMQLEGVFYQEEEGRDLEAIQSGLCSLIDLALGQLNDGRATEGAALAEDIRERCAAMRDSLGIIEARIPELSQEYEVRLRTRIQELNTDVGLSEERLAIEVALMAEKADVNEEVVRLKAHLDYVDTLLASKEPIGRELNFLTQELQREITTLGSKLRDLGVAREVMRVKTELEKLKEQTQNIE